MASELPCIFTKVDEFGPTLPARMMPVVWGNPCAWPGMTATQCAEGMAANVAQQWSLIREDDKEEWEKNLTFYLLNFGTARPCVPDGGLGQNASALYIADDQLSEPGTGWPQLNALAWLTPWFGRLGPNGEAIGGAVEAREWMDEFMSAYVVAAAAEALPTPKFVAFDTEELTADTWSLNGTTLLRNLQNDPRWNTMIVPGSSSTLAQLWTAWAGPGVSPADYVSAELELDPTTERGPNGSDPGNRDKVLKNRRAGMWYKSVCRMAHNASMKSAFYDAILSTWPDCRVFNYADVGYEQRLTQGQERLRWRFERVSTAATTWNDDQWTLSPSLTSDGLLGVRNVYQLPMTYLDRGCSGNPVADSQACDAAAFPIHLYPQPATSGDRIDQWHVDAPSLANNGKDLPGTDASPVFYGVSASQEQRDVNLPWLNFYDNCGDPATCSPSSYESSADDECTSYWREGLLLARDVSDAMFFSGYEAGNRIPWIPAPEALTFPADGGDRPSCPLHAEESAGTGLLDYMAFLRATRTTDAMVFFSDPGSSLNSCGFSGRQTAWLSAHDARIRAYAAQLVHIKVARGDHVAGTVEDARDIVPSPQSNLPQGFVVQSKFVTDDELFKFAHLCEVEFTVEVTRSMLTEMLAGGIKPRLFLETYVDGDESAAAIDRAPARMMAQLQIEVSDSGTRKFKMWSVGDRNLLGAQTILPENWFHFYTPDRSMRRAFDETITQTHDSLIDVGTDPEAPGIVRMKLIVRNKSGDTTPFRLHIDRFQLAFLHAGSTGESSGSGYGVAQGGSAPPLADANRSGEVNEVDIMVFATDAVANEPAADLDQDGLVTGEDISAFFDAYATEVQ